MGKMGSFDLSGMKELQKSLEGLRKSSDAFVEACAKELAARLLAMVVKRTPVGDYSHEVEAVAKRDSKHHKKGDVYKKKVNKSGKVGGTLRRGWTAQKEGSGLEGTGTGGVSQFVDSIMVKRFGDAYVIEIINPVEYASYVEYGHRTANHRGWVKGHFMMTISEQELQSIAPQILEKRIQKFLGGALK